MTLKFTVTDYCFSMLSSGVSCDRSIYWDAPSNSQIYVVRTRISSGSLIDYFHREPGSNYEFYLPENLSSRIVNYFAVTPTCLGMMIIIGPPEIKWDVKQVTQNKNNIHNYARRIPVSSWNFQLPSHVVLRFAEKASFSLFIRLVLFETPDTIVTNQWRYKLSLSSYVP